METVRSHIQKCWHIFKDDDGDCYGYNEKASASVPQTPTGAFSDSICSDGAVIVPV